MKFSKKIFIIVFFLLSLYIFVGLIFHISYTKIEKNEISVKDKISIYLSRLADPLNYYGISKLYFFSDKLIKKYKSNFILDFSENDLRKNDSLYNKLENLEIRILLDKYKKWRNFDIVFDDKKIKAKYKLHGSAANPYVLGSESFTIKSESEINGYNNFKLISGIEFTYFNIFSNYFAKKMNLISEDPGKIIITNSRGKIADFHQYSVFDENYLLKNYNLQNPTIIRRFTFWNNTPDWHSSNLDDLPYNIDTKYIKKETIQDWEKFLNYPSPNQFNSVYVGKFLGLLQFYGHPHQITGNNDKWIYSKSKFYPVFRNEGSASLLNYEEIAYSNFFKKYKSSNSMDVYKKLLTDSLVLNERNKTFFHLINNKSEIISDLDSIFIKYRNLHKNYNYNYLQLKYKHNNYKKIFELNSQELSKYLNSGHLIISYQGDNLLLKSTRKNMLEIDVDNKKTLFMPTKLLFKDGELVESNDQIIVSNIKNINSLKIKDLILNKYLENEKDFHIVIVN